MPTRGRRCDIVPQGCGAWDVVPSAEGVGMLRQLADGLWVFEVPHRFAGIRMGARSTTLRLADGRLALVSPVRLDDAGAAELGRLGEIAYIVAPSQFHWLFVAAAAKRWPRATIIGPASLRSKADFAIAAVFGESGAELPGVDRLAVGGMPGLDEHLFLHRATRTLVATDLFFHVLESPHWLTRAYLKLSGAYGRPAQTALEKFFVKDRQALAASREAALAWDFDRVIIAHGEVIETGGKEALRAALAWVGPA